MDKITEVLLAALRQAMAEPEQRLYKSGKLPGLFAGRTSVNAEAAERALREGLLETVQTDTKGKTPVEWVKITAQGVEFLLGHESPLRAMEELRTALQLSQDGVPAWVGEIRQSLQTLGDRLTAEVQAIARRLDALGQRVGEALKRAALRVPEGAAGPLPWAEEALDYLEKRRAGGLTAPCPLPELFDAVTRKEANLSLADFHSGLRRLYDRGMIRLLKFEGPGELPEPEYALLDGATVIYYAAAMEKGTLG